MHSPIRPHSLLLALVLAAAVAPAPGCIVGRAVVGVDPLVADAADVRAPEPDAPVEQCTHDDDCASTPATPVCDEATGACVGCRAEPTDSCPAAQHCDPDARRCVPGCHADPGCAGGTAPHCDPTVHACVACALDEHCPAGMRCVGHACAASCGSSPCPAGLTCCGGACVDTRTNAAHCGGCGAACTAANGEPGCSAGACAVARCTSPFADCDRRAANGCEVNTTADVMNCGGCSVACPARPNATPACAAGACRLSCNAGYADCDHDPNNGCEVALGTDTANCGACGAACVVANGTAACTGGRCGVAACSAGFADCDGNAANGCETRIAADAANCGACGNRCPMPASGTPVCVDGACGLGVCVAGRADCDGNRANGCESDTTSDTANCGACGRVCPAPPGGTAACTAGACGLGACVAGRANCDGNVANGCETDTTSDAANCGSCGRACEAGRVCRGGRCFCATGTSPCGTVCTDLANDAANCGVCGRACGAGQACAGGVCVGAGSLRVTLVWDVAGDMDLYVVTPGGATINWAGRMADGGVLDRDDTTGTGPENVYWSAAPPVGRYLLCAVPYSISATTTFSVTVSRPGLRSMVFTGTRASSAGSVTCSTSSPYYVGSFSI